MWRSVNVLPKCCDFCPATRRRPQSTNTNKVTVAPSDGWELIYCKGPEGEQLEFVKALGPVKQRFANALATHLGLAQPAGFGRDQHLYEG